MGLKFRKLRADEIDVRISTVNEWAVTLLLYKDARCDMNILDETVGPMNWKRSHSRDNANCTVSIYDEDRGFWVSKEDTGKESYTEKEKGLASDSFKRACFNWGIGRELYTSPEIRVRNDKCEIKPDKRNSGKWACYDKFRVTQILYDENGCICALAIKNVSKGTMAFSVDLRKKE